MYLLKNKRNFIIMVHFLVVANNSLQRRPETIFLYCHDPLTLNSIIRGLSAVLVS